MLQGATNPYPIVRQISYFRLRSTLSPTTRPRFPFGPYRGSSLQDTHLCAPRAPQTPRQEANHPCRPHAVNMPVPLPRLPCPILGMIRGEIGARWPASAPGSGGIHALMRRICRRFEGADRGGTVRTPRTANPADCFRISRVDANPLF